MSLPSVLAWLLYLIHWCKPSWYNKFIRACRFWSLVFMHGFSVESKTSGISSSSTSWQDLEARYKSSNEVNMTPRSLGIKPKKMKNSEDPVRIVPNLVGQGASSNLKRNRQQGPTCRRGKDLEDSGTRITHCSTDSIPWVRTWGKKGPLTMMEDLSACKSTWSLIRIYTVSCAVAGEQVIKIRSFIAFCIIFSFLLVFYIY
jgi:hypothetical protein